MTEKNLLKFAKLWKEARTDELTDMFTDDAIYKPSIVFAGKSVYRGKEEIAFAVEMIQTHDNLVQSVVKNIAIHNEFGFWEWEYTSADGERTLGCDVFTFRGDKIVEKNAFRKVGF